MYSEFHMAKKTKKKAKKVNDENLEFSNAKLIDMMMKYEPPREWYKETKKLLDCWIYCFLCLGC